MDTSTLKPISKAPKLATLPLDLPNQDTLPISLLIDPRASTPPTSLPKEQLLFCYKALLHTIDSLIAKRYTDFDGLTTSHCCHGIALLAWHLIQSAQELDLWKLKQSYQQVIYNIEQSTSSPIPLSNQDYAPKHLINLAGLYILQFIREPDPIKGCRSNMKKLKTLAPISANMYTEVSRGLQKTFANWTATSYEFYLSLLNEDIHVSGAHASLWGKYASSEFIRADNRGFKYVSNLFSTQLVLAYLSQSKAKIALVNDIRDPDTFKSIDRYTCVLQGDGKGGFTPIYSNTSTTKSLDFADQHEPIIVFGGCMYAKNTTKHSLALQMNSWTTKFPELILACDVFYPQFFKAKEDSEFNSTPIIPEEDLLLKLMETYSNYGTHPKDPSLYCSTHIHPASVSQVIEMQNHQQKICEFFIPQSHLQNAQIGC